MILFFCLVTLAMLVESALPQFHLADLLFAPLNDWGIYMATATAKTNGKSESAILTVEAILAVKDLKEETIEIPEWGGSVKIRSFSKKMQQEVREQSMVDGEIDSDRLEMYMFLRGVVEPLFTDDTYELLREKNAGVIDHILARVMSLSGMDIEAQKRAEKSFRS